MSVAAIEPESSTNGLLRAWRELDVPDGWRAEIIGEGISLMPPPEGKHNRIADLIQRQLYRVLASDCGIYQTLGIWIGMLDQLYVPDLVVMPVDLLDDGEDPYPADAALLVVEVTSKGNADTDRKTKLWGYAHAPVPLYLLVDRWSADGPSVTLYSEPSSGRYRSMVRVPFGKPIPLPEPFGLDLATDEFPAGD